MDAPPPINFADLAKDCADALKLAVEFVDSLFEENSRCKSLREAPVDGVGPFIFRHGGAEKTYACAWCNAEEAPASFQQCRFFPGLFIAVCADCSLIIYPGDAGSL